MWKSERRIMKTYSIASVTVAYNGADVLRTHLESLRRQTRKLDEIIVVDNASADHTCSLLANEYPEVTVLQLSENGGIAGGANAGVTYATLVKKHDWVWTLDQDSVAAPDALEQLLTALDRMRGAAEKTAILAPICVNTRTHVPYPALSWRGRHFELTIPHPNAEFTFVDMVISSGSLIRREAIEQAGLQRGDFFMDFVDFEHCLRLRRHGFSVVMVRDSVLEHAIGTSTQFKILGRTKTWSDHAPWREYYMARNETYTMWQYSPHPFTKAFVVYRMSHHAFSILLFGKNKLECLSMMWRGFLDGRAGRLGIRFRPDKKQDGFASSQPIGDALKQEL